VEIEELEDAQENQATKPEDDGQSKTVANDMKEYYEAKEYKMNQRIAQQSREIKVLKKAIDQTNTSQPKHINNENPELKQYKRTTENNDRMRYYSYEELNMK